MQTTKGAKRPGAERMRPDSKPTKQAKPKKAGPQTAQQTIPYRELFKDGICRVNDKLYTKSLEYEDINYQLAQADDQSAIFDGYCAFLNCSAACKAEGNRRRSRERMRKKRLKNG